MQLGGQAAPGHEQAGYAMAAMLVGIAVMSVMLSLALPVWRHAMQREKEAELIWRGEQYARAIGLYQRRYAGAFPPSLEVLVEQRFLRRLYDDPMTDDGQFQVLYAAGEAGRPPGGPAGQLAPAAPSVPGGGTPGRAGGIVGVVSRSTDQSIRVYNGRQRYDEWQFVYVATAQGPLEAPPGAAQPGAGLPGGQSRPAEPPMRGGSQLPEQPGQAGAPP